jgi:hypothetical protein
MGMESYFVKIHGPQADDRAVRRFAEAEFQLIPEPDPPSYAPRDNSYYSFRDGRHVIEWEFAPGRDVYELSLRFALCHPETVDDVFIQLVCRILDQFNAVVTILEPLPDEAMRDHCAKTKAEFARDCRGSIQICRGYWQATFGTRTAGLSHKDAMLEFVLPQCTPASI